MVNRNKRVCPVERTKWLDIKLRKWLHNPKKIFGEFIKDNSVILDVGCGSGFFTIELAKMMNNSGKIIAADLQKGMLKKVEQKIKGKEIEERIVLHKCNKDKIGISEKVDFVLAFYMVHEVPDEYKFLKEIKMILKPDGIFYVVEPKFHVSKIDFKNTINKATALGFKPIKKPRIFWSRAMIFRRCS